MRAPPELIAGLNDALVLAAKGLAQRRDPSWQNVHVERILAEPDFAARAVAAAQLPIGLVSSRQFDHSSEEMQQSILYYEDCVAPCVHRALELLRYEEVEQYIIAHRDAPEVQRLLQLPDARANLSAGLFRGLALQNPKNIVMELGSHRLVFLVREGHADLVLDDRGYLENVIPKILQAAGEGPRHVLLHKHRARKPPAPVILDLEKALYIEPEDSFGQVVGVADGDVIFEDAGGKQLRVPMLRFKRYRLLLFSG